MTNSSNSPSHVFVSGGTGHIGRALISALLQRGHSVEALVRPGSEKKLPSGCRVHVGNPLNQRSYRPFLSTDSTLVQLVGVAHPSPLKKTLFRTIDFAAGHAAVEAATEAKIRNLIYLSVAQPSPVMKAYVNVRREIEELIFERRLKASILRPWYVLGPGRRWPVLIRPLYWILRLFPKTQEMARRLDFVSTEEMTKALVRAVEDPPVGVRIWNVPDIRQQGMYVPE